jgi:type I restriction enzyme M protein
MVATHPSARSGGPVSLSTLESHLWEAANILRGPVDAADFKTYIFPLLFYKRISDVFREELSEALTVSDGDADYARYPELHRFQIPEGAAWQDVRDRPKNIGQALQKAFREIEKANEKTLYGVTCSTTTRRCSWATRTLIRIF